MEGGIKAKCHSSLVALYRVLRDAGIDYDEFIIENCPYLPAARNTLAAMFLSDPDATDLFFIDSDVAFDAAGAVRILERPESIVAGIYPLKKLLGGFPVKLRLQDGKPLGRDGLIEAELLPTGFMRIKRGVFDLLQKSYPDLQYADSVVEVSGYDIKEAFDYFHMGIEEGKQRWRTEDYAFCQRWRDLGGTLWVYPDVNFEHVGSYAYRGNLHEHLLQQPGGLKDPARDLVEAV